MERPGSKKGQIVIRTIFGDVAADHRNFSKPIDELMKDEEWRIKIGVEGGPFCYTDLERKIPF